VNLWCASGFLLLTACAPKAETELAQCKVERAVIAGEARELHGRLEAQEAKHDQDRDAARKALHQLSLYCPKVRG
jgi:hypothetical protein